jgi:hypothetical protein
MEIVVCMIPGVSSRLKFDLCQISMNICSVEFFASRRNVRDVRNTTYASPSVCISTGIAILPIMEFITAGSFHRSQVSPRDPRSVAEFSANLGIPKPSDELFSPESD